MSAYDLNALSGINASSQGLSVISNNLANSQTVGFKSGRAEFADMFSGSQKSPGNGVRVETITQDFNQGTITSTGRELDMAIDGEGFFILEDKAGRYNNLYTRNGSFKLDKEGFVTDQAGNNLLGFNLNQALSTETDPVFDTALNPINLADLNKTPKATDEMTYNINLNGEAEVNVDTNQALAVQSVGSDLNMLNLVNDGVNYEGFPDFIYPQTIHDSLGGEHRMTSNFYKRGVVAEDPAQRFESQFVTPYNDALTDYDAADPDTHQPLIDAYNALRDGIGPYGGNQFTLVNDPTDSIADQAAAIAADDGTTQDAITAEQAFRVGNDTNDLGQKYTSWIVQFDIQRQNPDTGLMETSGYRDDGTGNPSPQSGVIYELRFDTNGRLIDVREPNDPDDPAGVSNPNLALDSDEWTSVGAKVPEMAWVISNPGFGASDPLGGPIDEPLGISVDFEEMTQFAGDNLLRGVTQNGYKIGDLVGLTTNREGIIEARYSNGRSIAVAQLALGNFNDLNALEKLGGQMYAESFGSGPVQISKAGSGIVGSIQAGSLEYSNVDVAGELVKMIQTQRTYQASAQVISTSQELTRTILNL